MFEITSLEKMRSLQTCNHIIAHWNQQTLNLTNYVDISL